ncbi:MAG: MFS transporter [Phototrophicaceae bacterium]|jgi:MFS family permease
MTSSTVPPIASAKPKNRINPWLVIAFIAIPVFVGSLDLTVVSAFLPELILELELPLQDNLDEASWIVSGYLLAYTVSLTFTGRLSDIVGRRAVYVACLLLFIAGSVWVALAEGTPSNWIERLLRRFGQRPDPAIVDLISVIVGRVIQAIGAGALVPVSMALVGDMFPPERRAQPLGLIGALDTLGWVLGHLYGGLLLQLPVPIAFARTIGETVTPIANNPGFATLPWQGLFWINVPLSLLALGMLLWGLRDVPQARSGGRFDYIGTALIVGALILLNLSLGGNIETSTASSFEDMGTLPAFALQGTIGAVVLLVLFVIWELRHKDPLMNIQMFTQRNFAAGSLSNLFVGFCLMIGLVAVPILINVRQESVSDLRAAALEVGLLLSTLTVPMAIATIPGGWISSRFGYRATTIGGLLISAVGFAIVWQTWELNISTFNISWQMAIVGIGLGLTFAPITAAVINDANDRDRGMASALVLILRLVGMTLSVSILTSYSLSEVNRLAALVLGDSASADPFLYAQTYAEIAVQVLAQLGLIGTVVALVGCIPAAFMRGGGAATHG